MDGQQEVIEFLSRAAAYGPEIGAVERIDTHISAVFLAGTRAYKLKRAVRMPFLDFTTLEARAAACRNELEVNRRLAPDIYLGLAAVTREESGGLAIDGAGAVIDWLVVMRRFDQDGLFDRMAERGALTRDHMRDLAGAIARFHADAPVRGDRGGRASMLWTIDNNARSMAPFVPDVFAAEEVERLRAEAVDALDGVSEILERRRQDGRVRRCHGDLHLGNVCLYEGRPTPFDAIEFSDDIACIDVHYDLAFLLMDLDRRDLRPLASQVFNRYVELTGDAGALAAMPLFLSCRAAIRAHVSAAAGRNQPEGRRAAYDERARGYLARALRYLEPPPPRLVAVGGLSGSGKSRLAGGLAPFVGAAPGALVVRTDVIRKRLSGRPPEARLGAESYTPEMTDQTYGALYAAAADALAAGHGVIADAVFAKPEQRQAIEDVARKAGVPFTGLWLEAPAEVMMERVANRRANASDATVEVVRGQLDYDIGPMTWRRIDSSGAQGDSLRSARDAVGV